MKYLIIISLTLILFGCTKNESFKKVSWYKISNTPVVDTVLLEDYYFNKDDKLLIKIRWKPSKKIQSMFVYDDNEKVKGWITYYDTTMHNGQKCLYTYKNGEVVEQTFILFQKDSENETDIAKFKNSFDANNNLINTEIASANDTNQINYRYNKEGLVVAQSFILASGEVQSTGSSKYDTNNNLIWREIESPKKQEILTEIYNYEDSILHSKVLLKNGDTIRQEKYIYTNGIKSEINIIDKQETYRVIIDKKIVDKLPASNMTK